MKSKFKFPLIALSVVFFACESDRIEPKLDCNSSNLNIRLTSSISSSCSANDGSIIVAGSAGLPPYTFAINNGEFRTDSIFTELAAGNYIIAIQDKNGCRKNLNVNVANSSGLSTSTLAQDAGCGTSNGNITVTAAGGASPYQYKLNNSNFGNSNIFSGLTVGAYTITVQDANGCVETKTEQVFSGIKFSSSIATIISTNCATSGCHNGPISPNLTNFSSIQASAQAIKNATANRSMPKNGSLTQAQIDAIACWVNDGAPNN